MRIEHHLVDHHSDNANGDKARNRNEHIEEESLGLTRHSNSASPKVSASPHFCSDSPIPLIID
jgi:hypothetical protein